VFALGRTPPYHAVIFASQRTPGDNSYGATAERMAELAKSAPGCGITVSYWKDEESIRHWKAEMEHRAAQDRGKSEWYRHYELRVARVERAYAGPEGRR
jgi:hypothetical protein